MLEYESFHVAVRSAIERRGLSLDRLRDHLAARDVRISTSTLSNWQRGTGLPRSSESLRALAALEEVLGVPDGSLARQADRGAGSGPAPVGPGMPRQVAGELRAQLSADRTGLTVLNIQDEVQVRRPEPSRILSTRKVVRANRSGVDRHVVTYHSDTGSGRPQLRAMGACRLGRTLRHEDSGLLAAELLFAPLARGETFPIEYEVGDDHEDPYHGCWFRTPGVRYELTVRIDPDMGIRTAYRIRRPESGLPNRDLGELRLIGQTTAHLLLPDVSAGFHGVRWE